MTETPPTLTDFQQQQQQQQLTSIFDFLKAFFFFGFKQADASCAKFELVSVLEFAPLCAAHNNQSYSGMGRTCYDMIFVQQCV